MVDESKKPLRDQTPAVGKYLLMSVHIPPTMGEASFLQKQSASEIITTVDHTHHRVAWRNIAAPAFLLGAERWQALSEVNGKTKYESIEVFTGILAYIVKFFMRDGLVKGFNAMAEGLKRRSEQQ